MVTVRNPHEMVNVALEQLVENLGERALRDELLAPYTSMRVGGPADLLVVCRTVDEISDVLGWAREHSVPWRMLGGGCNVLVADAGVRGLVVVNKAEQVQIREGGIVWTEAGTSMSALAHKAVEQGLAGLEWAAGLPGTVGGAVVGNAGAFGGDISLVLRSATLLEPDGSVIEQTVDQLAFVYRGSRIKWQTGEERSVVLAATFGLRPGDPRDLKALADGILKWRRTRHPSGATMGSTFKNPPDGHAGWLIEQSGLKGHRIGGVSVSEQHGNFLINDGEATAADVLALIRHIQEEIENRLKIKLELEIELVGEW